MSTKLYLRCPVCDASFPPPVLFSCCDGSGYMDSGRTIEGAVRFVGQSAAERAARLCPFGFPAEEHSVSGSGVCPNCSPIADAIRAAECAAFETAAQITERGARHRLPCSCDYCSQSMRDAAAIRALKEVR